MLKTSVFDCLDFWSGLVGNGFRWKWTSLKRTVWTVWNFVETDANRDAFGELFTSFDGFGKFAETSWWIFKQFLDH